MRFARLSRTRAPRPNPRSLHTIALPARLVFGLLGLFVLLATAPVEAQTRSPEYWQFAASGRLRHAVTADMDGDGVDEVIIADENGVVSLVGADGSVRWSFRADQAPTAIGVVNLDGDETRARALILGGLDNIVALTADGSTLWAANLNEAASPVLLVEKDSAGTPDNSGRAARRPVAIAPMDIDRDGSDEALVLADTGRLIAFDAQGARAWEFSAQDETAGAVDPRLLVRDFDGDGLDEIALSLFTPRRFSELLFIDDGELRWREAISRRVTALSAAPFNPDRPTIAVGTNFGQVSLYDASGNDVWFRTVNVPITTLAFAELLDAPMLLVGTDAGSVVAYNAEGQRVWVNHLSRGADRRVLSLTPTEGRTAAGQSGVAVALETAADSGDLADVLLLSGRGQALAQLAETDLPGITRLVDLNRDRYPELLLGRFAGLQLVGLGVGDSEYIQEWTYSLDAAPQAVLYLDLDRDGEDEVIVGTQDGRLHALANNRAIRWLNAPGNEITHLAAMPGDSLQRPRIVVIRRQESEDALEEALSRSWLEVRDAEGELLWVNELADEVTALAVRSGGSAVEQEIIIGTSSGRIVVYDGDGVEVWTHAFEDLEGGVRHLLIVPGEVERPSLLLAGGTNEVHALSLKTRALVGMPYAAFDAPIAAMKLVEQPGGPELSVRVVIFNGDGEVHGLNWRGIEMGQWDWPYELGSGPTIITSGSPGAVEAFQQNATAFLLATEDDTVRQLSIADGQPTVTWQLNDLPNVEALFWDDLDKDGRPDTGLVGTRDGRLQLYRQLQTRDPQLALDLELQSAVFDLSLIQRSSSQSPDLFTVTGNGQVQLFREEVNRPPLLSNPEVIDERGQFEASVNVLDVEGDPVQVQLELFDATTQSWLPESEETMAAGNGRLVWPAVEAPPGSERVRYRFRFDDGFYRGYLTPPLGPSVTPLTPLASVTPIMGGLLAVTALIGGAFFVQQSKTPSAQARRFYAQIDDDPVAALAQLENKYRAVDGSPDFLLQLANRARQAGNNHIANLSDGFFLLANRPQAGLSIIVRSLDEKQAIDPRTSPLGYRRQIYKTCQALLDAPTITELSLLRPQLVHLLAVLEENEQWSPVLDSLLPVMTNLRDSERVDSVDDRLVYLNQAAVRLRQVQEQLPEYSPGVERTLVRAIARRWSGLVSAEIEELRGRAELQVMLKTRRIVPNGQTHVAVEIRNSGRAPAENIIATLEQDPAYHVYSEPQVIPFLPSGRSRQVRFQVEPQVTDRFRIALSLSYDDRNQRDKTVAFGDMVNLLTPAREFRPIPNPYLPGTPLRRESSLFYGREELFNFIAENAGTQAQRNVMMLVGQRRTGKTSLLLRLEEHLPSQLLPVYIDCQSLGVTPGMPALLQELAWHIADTLGPRGIEINVPEYEAWKRDPTRVFQRDFLGDVRAALPPEVTLLLVFDEFEAFEAMVADDILPPTLFTYMRHLVQHSDRLSFIFVGARRLEEMSADYWSVLFNIALYRKIDYLSEAAATRLICEPVTPYLVYDDLAIDKILRVTAGHPYFLQLVCYTLVRRANDRQAAYMTISEVNEALDEMLRLGEVHFAYLWQRSNYAERALLTAVAHLADRNEPLHPEQLTQYLQSFSIELDPAEVTNALNSLVERDIIREMTEEGKSLYELRIGLVGLWVAQNKSLSKLYAHQES